MMFCDTMSYTFVMIRVVAEPLSQSSIISYCTYMAIFSGYFFIHVPPAKL